jgi:hypothetical protein
MTMNKRDKEALEQCMASAMAESADRKWQLETLIEQSGWEQTAKLACYICQSKSLNLAPWQAPPFRATTDPMGSGASLRFAEKLDAKGISRYHPDPLAALEAAER